MEYKMMKNACFRSPWKIILLFFTANCIMIVHELIPVNAFEIIFGIAIVNAIMAGALGLYYANLRELSYLVLDDTGLTIKESIIRKGKRIEFDDIDAVMKCNDEIRIRLRSGIERRILLSIIELDGVRELKNRLEEKCHERIIR